MKYRAGYKYQLAADEFIKTGIRTKEEINTKFITLHPRGMLTIKAGYAWDGSSGPAIDTKNSMRASLIHDALYQLIRMNLLSVLFRRAANIEYWNACRTDGMSRIRAWMQYKAIELFGGSSSRPGKTKKVCEV